MVDGEALAGSLPIEDSMAAEGPGLVEKLDTDLAGELRRFILGVVRDPQVADDVMQATFLKSVEHGDEVRHETSRGWLFRVAFHEALALRRREKVRDQSLTKN